MSNLSLVSIMQSDPEFGRRISRKVEEIKQDKKNLLDIANTYENKYKQEVLEGTELRNRLLTEGTSQGLSEDQIMASYGRFVPCLRTPILNLLYFMLRESDGDNHYGKHHYERRDQMNESLIKNGKASVEETYNSSNFSRMSESEAERILDEFIDDRFAAPSSPERKSANAAFDAEKQTRPKEEEVALKEPENMVEYLYADLTLEQFDVLKKLKALTQSPNVPEATLAFRKGKELCEKYGLEWEKIPCYYKKK
jgi:soluble cytochrome b562